MSDKSSKRLLNRKVAAAVSAFLTCGALTQTVQVAGDMLTSPVAAIGIVLIVVVLGVFWALVKSGRVRKDSHLYELLVGPVQGTAQGAILFLAIALLTSRNDPSAPTITTPLVTPTPVPFGVSNLTFDPAPPSATDVVRVRACAEGVDTTGVSLALSVNTAPDGAANGAWRSLGTTRVACMRGDEGVEWAPRGSDVPWPPGRYQVRVEATAPHLPGYTAVLTATYSLLAGPEDAVGGATAMRGEWIELLGPYIANGGFEAGDLNGWQTEGGDFAVTEDNPRSGKWGMKKVHAPDADEDHPVRLWREFDVSAYQTFVNHGHGQVEYGGWFELSEFEGMTMTVTFYEGLEPIDRWGPTRLKGPSEGYIFIGNQSVLFPGTTRIQVEIHAWHQPGSGNNVDVDMDDLFLRLYFPPQP
jgi:hypothetical protein